MSPRLWLLGLGVRMGGWIVKGPLEFGASLREVWDGRLSGALEVDREMEADMLPLDMDLVEDPELGSTLVTTSQMYSRVSRDLSALVMPTVDISCITCSVDMGKVSAVCLKSAMWSSRHSGRAPAMS